MLDEEDEKEEEEEEVRGHSFPADMWAFGCLLFCVLMGKPPFPKPSQNISASAARRREKGVERERVCMREGDKVGLESVSSSALGLISHLLHTSPERRLTALEAMRHPFFFCPSEEEGEEGEDGERGGGKGDADETILSSPSTHSHSTRQPSLLTQEEEERGFRLPSTGRIIPIHHMSHHQNEEGRMGGGGGRGEEEESEREPSPQPSPSVGLPTPSPQPVPLHQSVRSHRPPLHPTPPSLLLSSSSHHESVREHKEERDMEVVVVGGDLRHLPHTSHTFLPSSLEAPPTLPSLPPLLRFDRSPSILHYSPSRCRLLLANQSHTLLLRSPPPPPSPNPNPSSSSSSRMGQKCVALLVNQSSPWDLSFFLLSSPSSSSDPYPILQQVYHLITARGGEGEMLENRVEVASAMKLLLSLLLQSSSSSLPSPLSVSPRKVVNLTQLSPSQHRLYLSASSLLSLIRSHSPFLILYLRQDLSLSLTPSHHLNT